MELKFWVLVFIFKVSSQDKALENDMSMKSGDQSKNDADYALTETGEDEEDFLDVEEDLDYFYTYEAIKKLEKMIPKENNDTTDLAEKFFLNFQTEVDEYDEEDYSYDDYEYEESTDRILAQSEDVDTDYIELDETGRDDFIFFTLDTMDELARQSTEGPLGRDTVLVIVVLAGVLVGLALLLSVHLLKSPTRQGGDVEVGDEGEQDVEDGETKEQEVDKDSLLAETV